MKIFVTGATGFVGSAVVQELLKNDHQVLGLARTDAGAEKLRTFGAEVHRGDLTEKRSLQSGAEKSDGVIHTGFIHDFSRFQECCEIDRGVIQILGDVLKGSHRPLITTSGVAIVKPGSIATELDLPLAGPPQHPRVASEEATTAAAETGVRSAVVRLAPSVHGEGDHGFVPHLIQLAREHGFSAYIGEGGNRWAAVDRFDAAVLYRLAFEKLAASAATGGQRFHGAAESAIPFRAIAEAIAHGLKLPAVSLSAESADAHFGWFARFAAIDCPTSNDITRSELGWKPKGKTLLEDLALGHYF